MADEMKCQQCGMNFPTQEELDMHNQEKHAK